MSKCNDCTEYKVWPQTRMQPREEDCRAGHFDTDNEIEAGEECPDFYSRTEAQDREDDMRYEAMRESR